MPKFIKKTVRATILNIIVAFIITLSFLLLVNLFFGARIDETISLVNKVSTDKNGKVVEETTMNEEKVIKHYPEYGTQYATIQIPKIDADLPVYFGDSLEILKKGVGHNSGSYFPGENGSIIYMGHNSADVFRRFSELEIGDEITVKASYGEFKYRIYDMQIVEETELDKLPIQKGKEILMVFTCYPFKNFGYTTQRYVVYSERI